MRLRNAQFFGRFDGRCDVAGFSVASLSATTPEHAVRPHEHEDGHFVLVLAGRYRSSARGAEAMLGPGDLVWNPPGTRHCDSFASVSGRFLALSLGAALARSLGLGEEAGPPRRLRDAALAQARALSWSAATDVPADLAELLHTEEQCLRLCALTGDPAPAAPRGEPAWLRRCMERLMDEGGRRPLRLSELAAEAGVHPVSLARAFRRQYGLAPGQLQRRAQLNRAAALLRGGQSPAAVALDCGFADQSHFTRAFRTEYRCTPAAWQAGFKTF